MRLLKEALHELQLVQALIGLLLALDVFTDGCLVATYSRYEIAASPEVLARKVAHPIAECPSNVDCALAFYVSDHL